MTAKYLALLPALLAACSAETGTTVDPISLNQGQAEENLAAYDKASDTVYVEIIPGSFLQFSDRNGAVPESSLVAYHTSGSSSYAIRGESSSGETEATVWTLNNTIYSGMEKERLVPTTLPGSGSVTYTGDYMGFYNTPDVGAGTEAVSGHIIGDAVFQIDFASNVVSGELGNRRNTGSATFDDVKFSGTPLVDGAFDQSGITSGARTDQTGYTVAAGRVTGLVSGSDGSEVGGNLFLIHQKDGSTEWYERGAFIAEE